MAKCGEGRLTVSISAGSMGKAWRRSSPLPRRAGPSHASPPEISGAIMQFKVWLLGLSPMVWRRVHVPATITLRQLHGVIQVAMGWEGIHLFQFRLRAVRYGSWEISARSPEATLESLRLRKGARFVYEYDLNVPWRQEIRLEECLEPISERSYPFCVDGHEACPPEDCGGPQAISPSARLGIPWTPSMISASWPKSSIRP